MNAPLPAQAVSTMAQRPYRMHNFLWHELRNRWLRYPKDVQARIRDLGWAPPRPAWDADEVPLTDNGSGEDYLFYHRQVIGYVNRILARVGAPDYPRVQGWVRLPPPGDADYPVPPPFFSPAIHPTILRYASVVKSDDAWQRYFLAWERLYTDPVFLRSIPLAELGSRLHWNLHNTSRWRWASAPGGLRPEPATTEDGGIPPVWDDPRNDFLADAYSMQLNPVYWRFYGWVDDRVEDWKIANATFGNEFWQATWMGKVPEVPPGDGSPPTLFQRLEDPERAATHVAEMQEVLRIIATVPLE